MWSLVIHVNDNQCRFTFQYRQGHLNLKQQILHFLKRLNCFFTILNTSAHPVIRQTTNKALAVSEYLSPVRLEAIRNTIETTMKDTRLPNRCKHTKKPNSLRAKHNTETMPSYFPQLQTTAFTKHQPINTNNISANTAEALTPATIWDIAHTNVHTKMATANVNSILPQNLSEVNIWAVLPRNIQITFMPN